VFVSLLVTDFYVQGGLHEPNLESHIGSHEPGVRIYIGLDNPPHRAIGFEVELGSIRINWYQSTFDPWAPGLNGKNEPYRKRGRMNCRDAGCLGDGFVTDIHVQGGLHEPNLESHIGSHESGVRIYIGLDNPPH